MRIPARAHPEYEREPTIERGKDIATFWAKVLAVVVVVAIVIGYVASVSYQQYPYTVTVSGTYTTPEGARATEIGLPACNAWVYQQCPDPGQSPSYDCHAPPQLNLGGQCVTYNFDSTPGQYHVNLRNGENYTLAGYMEFQNGTFEKACFTPVALVPQTHQRNVTQNLVC